MNTLTRSTLGQTVSSRVLPLWLLSMVGRLLQNSTMYICMQQSILIQLQHSMFSFNDYIDSTSKLDISFDDYIFIQFQHGPFLCKTNIYSTSMPKVMFYEANIGIQLQRKKYFHSTKHIYSTLQFPGHR